MKQEKLLGILDTRDSLMKDVVVIERDGYKLEKGVSLTEKYLESIEDELRDKMSFYSGYPDLFLDEIKPKEEKFCFYFY